MQPTSVRPSPGRTRDWGTSGRQRRLPCHLPSTTVPPTLLLRLPRLPDKLAYRIVGHDFVLQDTEARLIVDFIPEHSRNNSCEKCDVALSCLSCFWAARQRAYGRRTSRCPSRPARYVSAVHRRHGDRRTCPVRGRASACWRFIRNFLSLYAHAGRQHLRGSSPTDMQKKFEVPYKPLMDAGVQFYASLGES